MSKLPTTFPEGTMIKTVSQKGLDVMVATSNYKIEGYLWAYYISSEGISIHETVFELNMFLDGRMDLDIKDLERNPLECVKFLDTLIKMGEETGDDVAPMKRYRDTFAEDAKKPNSNPHLAWMRETITS